MEFMQEPQKRMSRRKALVVLGAPIALTAIAFLGIGYFWGSSKREENAGQETSLASTNESSAANYLNEDFTDIRQYAQAHSYDAFISYLSNLNKNAFTEMTDKQQILQTMEYARIHDDIWTNARRTVVPDSFHPQAIGTKDKPGEGGIFLYDANNLSTMLFALELNI